MSEKKTAVTKTKSASPAPAARLKFMLSENTVKSRFEEVLGKRSAGFMSSILSLANSNKLLSEAEPMSVISAAMIAASMDLPINPGLGFAHIVPYRDNKAGLVIAQFQIGWKGIVQLAMRSGQYKTLNIVDIKEGQIKTWNRFTGEMEFQPEATSDKAIGYLLYFKLLNGFEKYFYMTREEVAAHAKEYSASFKKGYGMWVDDFEAMALKTVAKLGLGKYGILSVEMQKAATYDQAVVRTIEPDAEPFFVDHESVEGPEAASALPPGKSRLDKLIEGTEPAQEKAVAPAEAPAPQAPADPESFDEMCKPDYKPPGQTTSPGT